MNRRGVLAAGEREKVRHDHRLVAVEANVVVQQQEIEGLNSDPREASPDVVGDADRVAVRGQDGPQALPRMNIALHDENPQRHK